MGTQGIQGETGPEGPQGDQGMQGEQGEDGVGIAQTLTISGDTLSISDGNSIVLPSEESCLDASNIELSSSIVDVYANSSQVNQAIGTCVQYTAAEDISNGSVCVTVISNNKVMAANPSDLGSQMEYEKLIGIALEDAVAGETIRILEEGYCTVRADEILFGVPQSEVLLNQTTNGNTYSVEETTVTFMDSGGDGANYSNGEDYSITFDAGSGNTAEIVIDSLSTWEFEHGSISMYDRLGFQTSTDGIIWNNASIMGMCSSIDINPPWSTSQDNDMNGYVFPETFNGSEPFVFGPLNPISNNNGSQMALQILPAIIAPGTRYLRFYFTSDNSLNRPGWNFKIKGNSTVFQVNDLLYLSGTNLENASNTATGSAALGYGLLGAENGSGSYVFARIHDR